MIVSLIVGVLVTVIASLRPARRATRVPPIAAVREGATLPPGRFRALPPRRLGAARPRRFRAARVRAVRPRPLDGAAAPGHGRRRRPDLLRRRVLLCAARDAARARARRPGGEVRGRSGDPRARERDAEPPAHGLDGFRAHDRARARDARRHAGGVDPLVVLRRRRQDLGDRLRRHGAEQLLADPDQRQEPLRDVPGTTAVVGVRAGEASFLNGTTSSRPSTRAPARSSSWSGSHGSNAGHGPARRRRRVHRRRVRRGSQP